MGGLRRNFGCLFAANVRLSVRWIRLESNPADEPSRRYQPGQHYRLSPQPSRPEHGAAEAAGNAPRPSGAFPVSLAMQRARAAYFGGLRLSRKVRLGRPFAFPFKAWLSTQPSLCSPPGLGRGGPWPVAPGAEQSSPTDTGALHLFAAPPPGLALPPGLAAVGTRAMG